MKVLVVDDNDSVRELQCSILAGEGYQVSVASNGQEALQQIAQSKPELIITDILMPVMDGYELCRRVKADEALRDIPFVFYSAHYRDAKDREMAMDLGVKHFIEKPMEGEDFLRAINDIVAETGSQGVDAPNPRRKDDSQLEKEHEQRLTEMLYGKLGELKESHAKLKKVLEDTIAAIALAVEARDPYTAGHQQRVAQLAEAIAKRMGLDPDRVEGIRMGAMIHDIGKIRLPAELLSKPSTLSDIEMAIVHEHSSVGYDILKTIDFPWPVADIAYQHHERMDGSGYPQGLKGDDICQEARIVAVADTVEAMASHRPYRASLGIEQALQEISSNRGTWYDAEAVDACLALFEEGQFSFE